MTDVPKEYMSWFLGELELLCDEILDNKVDGYAEFEWPTVGPHVHESDIRLTLEYVANTFPSTTSYCTLVKLPELLNSPASTIDYFFIRMHCCAHVIMKHKYPNLDLEVLSDVAFAEVVSTYYALIATYHYFRIEHMTARMAQILSDTLFEKAQIEAMEGIVYTEQDRLEATTILLKDLFKREKSIERQ